MKNHFWKWMIPISLVCGILLRTLFVEDMEYKEDEMINFTATQPGRDNWPWAGMPSGVYLQNPGMSIWVFTALARVFRATTPTELCTAVQIFALAGIMLLLGFVLRWLPSKDESSREPWLWAFALAMVNPLAVYYQRKLWPEPILPFFSMLVIMGWWKREQFGWAFLWGLIGAALGQIHMSGFFFSAGIVLWTLLFRRRETRWSGWFLGSVLGALPLIPWYLHVRQNPPVAGIGSSVEEIIQLKYWVFWITNPLGLHLGNALGVLRGNSHWAQLSDFVRYPIIAGTPTYLNALAHLVLLGIGMRILSDAVRSVIRSFRTKGAWAPILTGASSRESFLISATGLVAGILLTATGVKIRRYYLMVVFPLDFVWLARLASRRTLLVLWAAQLFVSACFVGYIHVNEGAEQGDYGTAWHRLNKSGQETGTSK